MGRIQSSIGLITGTDIVGTVDQLIKLSGRPRDRLVSRTDLLDKERAAITRLTASVIGVQLAGNQLSKASAFQSKKAVSDHTEALSATAGNNAKPATHVVRTLQSAATHSVSSLQRYQSAETALGFTGSLSINPRGGLVAGSASLSKLNDGRGVEAGSIRITDRSGGSAIVDLTDARTIDDVLTAINDAEIDIRATTDANAIQLVDTSGSTLSNLKVEQLGTAETAADLGLWGIDAAADQVSGSQLELPDGVSALRGTALSELAGGSGAGPLTDLDITLADGTTASIDLSGASTTSDVIDAINAAGLSLIARYNDAQNGLQIRDASGGSGSFTISSSDGTAAALGIDASTTGKIVVGKNLNRQTVTAETLLADLNQGAGVDTRSFLITDSNGTVGAINPAASEIKTVGELITAINNLSINVTASLNEAGDGIAIVDNAGGSKTLTIKDNGTGTTAADLGIAGTATDQTIGGSVVSALVGTQASVIDVEADDTLTTLAAKITADGRYGDASVQLNDDGSFSLRVRSNRAGAAGKVAINTSGFELDLRTESRGQDALIAVSTDGGAERVHSSADGVFDLDGQGGAFRTVKRSTLLTDLAAAAAGGSFTIKDSAGVTTAINLTVEKITTVGELVDAINSRGIGVTASINSAGSGISVVDTAGGTQKLTITDAGNHKAAASLGIAGDATLKTIDGASVSALVGPAKGTASSTTGGGLVLTLKQLSEKPITVKVTGDTSGVVKSAKTFVDQFNSLVDQLSTLTAFNAETDEVGLLFGSSEALRISSGFTRMLSGTITGAGDIKSIGQVGMRFNEEGKIDFDSSKLSDALESDRAEVERFFTTAETGLAKRISDLSDRIAGADGGLLITRTRTLTTQIERNNDQIDTLNSRLEKERERLLKQFYKTEEAISKLQSNSSAINQIERITIPT